MVFAVWLARDANQPVESLYAGTSISFGFHNQQIFPCHTRQKDSFNEHKHQYNKPNIGETLQIFLILHLTLRNRFRTI